MKKTLLCVLFLFSLVIYSQPNTNVCHGASVDLYLTAATSIGNLNPNNAPVTFHHSIQEALDNLNPIANPSIYKVSSSSENIYVRIEGVDNYPVFSLTEIPALNVSVSSKPILCKGETASLSITVSGGSGSYQYSLNGSAFTSNDYYSYLPAGVYNIQVLDIVTGCKTPYTYEITEPTVLVATGMVDNQNAIITAMGGTAPYQYSLDGMNFQTSPVFPHIIPGSYYVHVRDAQGCGAVVAVNVPPILTATAFITKSIDCYGNAMITTNAAGGVGPYTYSINGAPFQSGNIFNNLSAGTYSIIVRDAVNTVSNPYAVTVSPYISLQNPAVVVKQPDCQSNAMITVEQYGGTAPYSYSFDGGVNYTNSNVLMNAAVGTYVVLVRDRLDCVSLPTTVKIDPFERLTAVAANTPILCRGENASLTITASGGKAPYQYSINNGVLTINNVFTDLKAGNYIIKVMDAAGCEKIFPYVITEPSAVEAQMVINGNTISIINATGGTGSYFYSIDNGNFQTTNVFTNVNPGIHIVRVKDSNNCEAGSFSAEIANPITVAASITKALECSSGAEVTVTATGGSIPYFYSINGTTFQTSNVFTNLAAGSYTATVKDNDGNFSSQSIIINPLMPIYPDFTTDNQTLTITGQGGTAPYEYSIDFGPYQTNNIFPNLSPGWHTVFLKDSKGCVSYAFTINIEAPNSLTSTVAITKTVDCISNASLLITATGGQTPYAYSIDGGINYQASNTFVNLIAGNYTVIVKDANNNTKINTLIIPGYSPIEASWTYTNTHCIGSNDGTIKINATGGTAPYLYSINNGPYGSGSLFSGLAAADYTINVKDSAGCLNSYIVTILQPSPLSLDNVVTNSTSYNSNDGKITLTATGGVSPYQYSLKTESGLVIVARQSSNVFEGLSIGRYTIEVIDSNGCTTNKTGITITSSTLFGTLMTTPVTCTTLGSITINAAGGKYPHQYSFNNGATYGSSNIAANLQAGTYTIKVKDAEGYILTLSATLAALTPLVATTTIVSEVHCYGGKDGTVQVTATGGKAPYLYSINNTSFVNTNTFTNLPAGTYSVSVKDAMGCLDLYTVTIDQPTAITATVTTENSTTVSDDNGKITVKAAGGVAPYNYALTDQTGLPIGPYQSSNTFIGLKSGLYGVQVRDVNGCITLQTNITVENKANTLVGVISTITQATCMNPYGTIIVNATGGTAPYTYSVNNGIYQSSNTFYLVPGNYSIKIKDATNNTVNLTATIIQASTPVATGTVISNVLCKGESNGIITIMGIGGQAPYSYSLNNGVYALSASSTITFTNLPAGNHIVNMKDANGCIATVPIVVSEPSTFLAVTSIVANQTVTVSASGGTAPYRYAISPNLNQFSAINFFSDLAPGIYSVVTVDSNGCTVLMDVVVDPPTPVIDGKNEVTAEFKTGQTLADITPEGENIKWYSSPGSSTGNTNKTNETPLPLTTILVDGTTYYASQTVNGIESKNRLAVTVKLNGTLSTPDFDLTAFEFYPNPVKDVLTIKSNSIIDSVEIIDVSGKSILLKKVNDLNANIDLSNLSSGVYILKAKSENSEKVKKFIKN